MQSKSVCYVMNAPLTCSYVRKAKLTKYLIQPLNQVT